MTPPRWTSALLRWAAPPTEVDDVLGDLEEAHRKRAARRGRFVATVVTGMEALDMALALMRRRRVGRRGVSPLRGGSPRRSESGRSGARMSLLDLKVGARMLVRYPGLTLVGGLAIAFSIAVGAATFELATQVVHPTLPLDGGERLVGIETRDAARGRRERQVLPDLVRWRQELRSIEELGAFRTIERNLITGDGVGEPTPVAEISASGFRVARVPPLLGRTLVDADEQTGAPPVVVIGEHVWRTRFAADPDIIGRRIRVGAAESTVVGVMPARFEFPVSHSVWVPLRVDAFAYERGQGPQVMVFGRLAPGATLEDAQAEVVAAGQRAAADFPDTHEHLRPRVLPYARSVMDVPWGALTGAAYSANAFVVLFLLLVCANVATLVFARTATRENEIVVRSALGASRGRIATQLFSEALVLGGVAALVGLAAAFLAMKAALGVFETVQGGGLPFWVSPGLGPLTVLYAAGLTVLGALIAGAIPALKATGAGVQNRLREAAVGGANARFGRLWTGIIITQVAVTVVFVPITIDVARDTGQIRAPDVGFAADEFLSVRVEMDRETAPGMSAEEARDAFTTRFRDSYRELERRLRATPGVSAVTFASQLPGGFHSRYHIEVDGPAAPPRTGEGHRVQVANVDPGFFDVLGAPVLAGRGFHSADLASDARVVLVNPSFIDEVLGGRNPIGRRVRYLYPGDDDAPVSGVREPGPWHEIVGVVREVALTIDPDLPHSAGLYHPASVGTLHPIRMGVHVSGDPDALAPQVRALATEVDPSLRLYDIRPLDEIQRDLQLSYTFWLQVAVVAGMILLTLSLAGIYSIMSFTVARRTREIGIRAALGADKRRIVMGIFSRALRQIGAGIVVGAILLGLTMGGVGSLEDAMALAGYLVLMTGICTLACVLPARRALRIEPTLAMREE